VRVDEALYGAPAATILRRLRALDDGVGSAMVLAHNPGLQDLALELTGAGDADARSQLRAKFPTGALATLELGDGGWGDLRPGRAHLARLVLPRQLS
jgi:phosphohistidine phosphatase